VQVHGSMYFTADENLYHETGRYSMDYQLNTSFELDDIPLFFGGSVGVVTRYNSDGINDFNNITWGSHIQYGPFYLSASGYLIIDMSMCIGPSPPTYSLGIDYPLTDNLRLIFEGAFRAKEYPIFGAGLELTL